MKFAKCTLKDVTHLSKLAAVNVQENLGAAAFHEAAIQKVTAQAKSFYSFFEKRIINNLSEVYKITDGAACVGYCSVSLVPNIENGMLWGEIEGNYILPGANKSKYAMLSLVFMENRLVELNYDRAFIWLADSAKKLIGFYTRLGFSPDHEGCKAAPNEQTALIRYHKKLFPAVADLQEEIVKAVHGIRTE